MDISSMMGGSQAPANKAFSNSSAETNFGAVTFGGAPPDWIWPVVAIAGAKPVARPPRRSAAAC